MNGPVIVAEDLEKRFGAVRALDGVSLEVQEGTVLGLLGPNGAGKTTTVRILATLLQPDGGRAMVGGYDVAREPARVRELIGLTGQYAAVDELLSGYENLLMIGALVGLSKREAPQRARELLGEFHLADAADKVAKTYSGGMRRRLDLAASLVGRPRFLYLDEPTTGLDPRSRRQVWDMIDAMATEGTTVLLTTQYLDEADKLADSVVVIDHGRVVANGTPDELKEKVGGRIIEARLQDRADIEAATWILGGLAADEPTVDAAAGLLSVPVADATLLSAAARAFDDAQISVLELALRRPSLDEVFLALTGHPAEETPAENEGATR